MLLLEVLGSITRAKKSSLELIFKLNGLQEIGTFFMDIVNSSHSYATGGTSVGEFWYKD